MKRHSPIPPLLAAENLTVSFATPRGTVQAVRQLHLTLQRGEVLAIVGESGSGKSVTAQALLGLLPAHAAVNYDAISFKQRPLSAMSAAELRRYRGGNVGMIFQEPASAFDPLYPIGKTLREVIVAHAPDMKPPRIKEQSIRLLYEIGIEDAPRRLLNYPHQFSGGQLQRISLALAIAAEPEVLLADEPTTALDVTVQAEIIALLQRTIVSHALSVIFISHDIALVASIADRIAVMYNGYIVETGDCADVIHAPHHPYTAALLQSIIRLGVHYRNDSLTPIRGTPPSPFALPTGCPFAERCDYVRPVCRTAVPPLRVAESAGQRAQAGGRAAAAPLPSGQRAAAAVSSPHRHRCVLSGSKAP